MAGTAAGQLVAAAAAPVLSRLYSPSDFGVFSVVSALAITLGTVTALRYESAIPLPSTDEDARSLVVVGMIICLVSALLLGLAVWLFSPWVAEMLDEPRLKPWLITVPLIAALFGLFRLLNQWALRAQRYAATARRNVLQSVVTVVVQIVVGWRAPGAGGLVSGLAVGQGLGAASLLSGASLRGKVARESLGTNLVRYRRFPLTLAPAGLINAAGVYVPLLMVAALYGTDAAGWLGFTQRILALPMMLIGQSVAQVYLSELAKTHRDGTSGEAALFWSATKKLSILGALGAAVFLCAGPGLFALVFGGAWRTSGSMAQALSISLAAQLVASSLSQTLVVFERTGLQLAWDITRLATVVGTIALCSAQGASLLTCIWALSVASALTYALSWELSRRAVNSRCRLQA